MSIPYKTVKLVDIAHWNNLVEKTYARPYDLSDQEGRDRGIVEFVVPLARVDDYNRTTLAKYEKGVSFDTWLHRDVNEPFEPSKNDPYYIINYFRQRFYPTLEMVINDLHLKGLLEPGHYIINIDF